jgi:methyl-accepting chemotaxis protein
VLSVSKASSEEMIQRVTSMLILMAFCFFVGFLLYQQLEAKRKRQFLTQARQHLERIQIASHNVAIVTDNVNQLSVITEKLSASCHESASKGMIVSDHIFTTRGNFDHLSTEALHINKMLKEINNIAQKTKLLALNATIEAASAGEAGQGFTIVAEEVQKLALRTSDSTSDITERLHRISSLIDNTSGQIDSIMSSTQDSEASTSSLSSDANRLSRTIQDVDTLVQEMHTKASSTSETIAQLQRDLERYFS